MSEKDVLPLSRFQALLGRARGAKRRDFLLSQPDAAALVAELPVQDLYYVIKEAGLADSVEILELATPEQIQGFLDLDAWKGDQLEPAEVRPWLGALLDAGPEKLTEVWRGLDQELTALLFARWTRIYNLAEEEVPEDEEPPFFPTPDRFFLVKIVTEDPEEARLIERTLDYLYRVDQELARHTLRAAASEPVAYLEEHAHRFRSGRMQDLGYADYYESLEVYRPIKLGGEGGVAIGEGTADQPPDATTTLPAPLAEGGLRQGFLGRVLVQITDSVEARRLESALILLINRVLSADRVDPGDLQAAARGAARAAGRLSLGLEAVARGDAGRGLEALRSISLTRLHRTGHTLTLRLVKLLDVLGARAARAEEPWLSLIAALRELRPAFPRVLDEPPQPGSRPFLTLADVARVTAAIGDLALQVRLVFDVLGQDPVKLGEGVSLGDVGRTAIVNAALGKGATFRPLAPKDVLAFQATPETRARVVDLFPREYRGVISGWMGDLERAQKGLVFE